MSDIKISAEAMARLEERLAYLTSQGIEADPNQSGELNKQGCRSSTCSAWD